MDATGKIKITLKRNVIIPHYRLLFNMVKITQAELPGFSWLQFTSGPSVSDRFIKAYFSVRPRGLFTGVWVWHKVRYVWVHQHTPEWRWWWWWMTGSCSTKLNTTLIKQDNVSVHFTSIFSSEVFESLWTLMMSSGWRTPPVYEGVISLLYKGGRKGANDYFLKVQFRWLGSLICVFLSLHSITEAYVLARKNCHLPSFPFWKSGSIFVFRTHRVRCH